MWSMSEWVDRKLNHMRLNFGLSRCCVYCKAILIIVALYYDLLLTFRCCRMLSSLPFQGFMVFSSSYTIEIACGESFFAEKEKLQTVEANILTKRADLSKFEVLHPPSSHTRSSPDWILMRCCQRRHPQTCEDNAHGLAVCDGSHDLRLCSLSLSDGDSSVAAKPASDPNFPKISKHNGPPWSLFNTNVFSSSMPRRRVRVQHIICMVYNFVLQDELKVDARRLSLPW